jgi:hypothetical protein
MSSPTDTKQNMIARQSFSSSPRLVTPSGSPPGMAAQGFPSTFSEARLAQLLSRFDDGTHIFDREERETPEDRRMSFNDGESETVSMSGPFLTTVPPAHPAQRRGSFLSGLSLTRPGFGFSSSPSSGTSTPIYSAAKDTVMSSLAMTSTTSAEPEPISRPKSTPLVQQQHSKHVRPEGHLLRSNTAPQKGGFTFNGSQAQNHYPAPQEEPRHFDPSKEPRLFGLL